MLKIRAVATKGFCINSHFTQQENFENWSKMNLLTLFYYFHNFDTKLEMLFF